MHVRPMTRYDLPAATDIAFYAFEEDELFRWLNPRRDEYPGDLRRNHSIRLRERIVTPGQYGFVAVTDQEDSDWDGQEKVLGFASFIRSVGDKAAKKWRSDTLFNKFERKLLQWELWYDTKFLNRAEDSKRLGQYIGISPWVYFAPINPRWHLAMLCVSPNYQRRGVGGLLLRHGQAMATDEKLPVTLEASVPGRGLYLKHGFKMVDEMTLCAGIVDVLMLWEPSGMEGTWLENIEAESAKMKRRRERVSTT